MLGLQRTLTVVQIAERVKTEQVCRQLNPGLHRMETIHERFQVYERMRMPAVLGFERQRLEDLETHASLGYIAIIRPV